MLLTRNAESPKDMDELHTAMLNKIEPKHQLGASRYFQLLLNLDRSGAGDGIDYVSLVDSSFTNFGLDESHNLSPLNQLTITRRKTSSNGASLSLVDYSNVVVVYYT